MNFSFPFASWQVEFPEARILEETLNVLLYEQVESENDDFEFDFVARAGDRGFLYSDEEEDHGAKRKWRSLLQTEGDIQIVSKNIKSLLWNCSKEAIL